MMSAKQYLCLRCKKGIKLTSRLTKHLNVCIKEVPQIAHLHKLHDDPVNISDENLEDGNQLLDETNYIIRDATDLPTERTP